MAVYTDISANDREAIRKAYCLASESRFTPISEGVENSNYLVDSDGQHFVLTIYEKRVNALDVPFFLALMEHSARHGIPCPLPIQTQGGEQLFYIGPKPAALFSFLPGKSPKRIQNEHCEQVGRMLAKLHVVTSNFAGERANALSVPNLASLIKQIGEDANRFKPGFAAWLNDTYAAIVKQWPKRLPQGVIHADLFPDNVLFNRAHLSGLLDFYFACNDDYAYDLAICLNAWCFEQHHEFNITKAKHLLQGYNEVRQLTREEIQALPVLAQGAAMRFLLTRLQDFLKPAKGAIVKPKDPKEYITKLNFHANVKSASEYGL